MATEREAQRLLGHCVGVALLNERKANLGTDYEQVGWVQGQPTCYEVNIAGAFGRLQFTPEHLVKARSMDRDQKQRLMDQLREGLRLLRSGEAGGDGCTFDVPAP